MNPQVGLGVLHIPQTQETTMQLTQQHGIWGPRITLPKPFVEIQTLCSFSSQSCVHSCVIRPLISNAPQWDFFRGSWSLHFSKTEIQNKTQMAHMNASAQSNKLGHKSDKSKQLFLLPTGYLTQIQDEPAHSKEKSPKPRGVTFWLCTPERLALLHGAGWLPNVKSLLQLQELAQPGLLQGTLKERSSRKWSQQLLGPYLKIPRWGLAGHELWFLWLALPNLLESPRSYCSLLNGLINWEMNYWGKKERFYLENLQPERMSVSQNHLP